jgi:hypothetical protein
MIIPLHPVLVVALTATKTRRVIRYYIYPLSIETLQHCFFFGSHLPTSAWAFAQVLFHWMHGSQMYSALESLFFYFLLFSYVLIIV